MFTLSLSLLSCGIVVNVLSASRSLSLGGGRFRFASAKLQPFLSLCKYFYALKHILLISEP